MSSHRLRRPASNDVRKKSEAVTTNIVSGTNIDALLLLTKEEALLHPFAHRPPLGAWLPNLSRARKELITFGCAADWLYLIATIGYVLLDWSGLFPYFGFEVPSKYAILAMYTFLSSLFVVDGFLYWLAYEIEYDSVDVPTSAARRAEALALLGRLAEIVNVLSAVMYFMGSLGPFLDSTSWLVWVLAHCINVVSMFLWLFDSLLYLAFNTMAEYVPTFETHGFFRGVADMCRTCTANLTSNIYFWSDIANVFASLMYVVASLYALYVYANLTECGDGRHSTSQVCISALDSMFGDGSLDSVRLMQVHGDYLWLVSALLLVLARHNAAFGDDVKVTDD